MSSGLVSAVCAVGSLGACQTDPPACKVVDDTCELQYAPTFDNLYTNTLQTGCGSTKNACHSRVGMRGGMSFEDEAHAYAALLDHRVTPGDPGCSLMVVRTDSPGTDYQMPPGTPLSKFERCAIVQWVLHNAPGPGQPLFDVGVPDAPPDTP